MAMMTKASADVGPMALRVMGPRRGRLFSFIGTPLAEGRATDHGGYGIAMSVDDRPDPADAPRRIAEYRQTGTSLSEVAPRIVDTAQSDQR